MLFGHDAANSYSISNEGTKLRMKTTVPHPLAGATCCTSIVKRSSAPPAAALCLLFACGALDTVLAQEGPLYGPTSGTLMIVGGAAGPELLRRFVEMAGGTNAHLIVAPTAGGNSNAFGKIKLYKEDDVVARWRKLGVKDVHMLHTHDRKVANSEAFVQFLRKANAVWFDGGRQWNLVDSYAGTLTEKEFHNVLARGGIIGGSSAGATIQGDYLVRGAIAGPQIMMTAEAK